MFNPMFERYTEKARRVIFFARYEASQYGRSSIETEHILLGLLREDRALMSRFHLDLGPEIRDEIDRVVYRGTRVSTSIEMPLSTDSQKIFTLAAEESERLGNRHIGTEHILLGILRVEESLAAKLLSAKGAKADVIRTQVASVVGVVTHRTGASPSDWVHAPLGISGALNTLDRFLALLKNGASGELADLFFRKGQFIDSSGQHWLGQAEIEKAAEILLAPFAKRNATFRIEDTTPGPSHTLIASVLWEFAAASTGRSKSVLRMSIVLAWTDEEWAIILTQVTPVALS